MSRAGRVRPSRRPRRGLILLCLLAAGSAVAWPRVQQHDAFRVEVVRLHGCPDELREAVHARVEPLLGRDFFAVFAAAGRYTTAIAELPEIARAELRCVLPDRVELSLLPRTPQYALPAPGGWLNVDGEGVIVRVTDRPAAGLTRVHGLRPAEIAPGSRVRGVDWLAVTATRAAADVVLGRPPQTIALDPGPSLRLRTAAGELVQLGAATDLERKLQVYQAVRNRLAGPARYVDVSVPEAPAWAPGG